MENDPFAFLFEEAGTVPRAQLELILNTPFINNTSLPTEPQPEPEPSSDHGSGSGGLLPQAVRVQASELAAGARSGPPRNRSNPKRARGAPMDLLDALKLLSPAPDKSLENLDILEIAAMKGIHFEPVRWHRPGGYDRKPRNPQ